MSKKTEILHDHVITRIIAAWEKDQAHPHHHREPKEPPSQEEVRTLVETAFLAGLEREEGQPVSFSVTLYSRTLASEEGTLDAVQVFDRILPLTVHQLVKLASAFDAKAASLLVGPTTERDSGYGIWGVIFPDTLADFLDSIPVWMQGLTVSRLDALTVTAMRPGELVISRKNSRIAEFSLGEVRPPYPTPLHSEALGGHVIEIISDNDGFRRFEARYWGPYSSLLVRLLDDISHRGHGGTVIIVQETRLDQCEEFFEPRYGFQNSSRFELDSLLVSLLQASERNSEDELTSLRQAKRKQALRDRVSALAELACIDGALILTNRLRLVSFGALLSVSESEWQGKVITGRYDLEGAGSEFDTSTVGSRHMSAIRFVGRCPDSVGFVISHDGPIRGLAHENDHTVLVWHDCRASVFV